MNNDSDSQFFRILDGWDCDKYETVVIHALEK